MTKTGKYRSSLYRRWLAWEIQSPRVSFVLELVLALGAFAYLFAVAVSHLPVSIQWQRLPSYFWNNGSGPFLLGLLQTLKLVAWALVLALAIGYVAALLRLSRIPSERAIAGLYIQLVRNTPLLVQLYVGYFLFSPLFGLSSFGTALLVLSLFEGAYTAEIIRNEIENIGHRQQQGQPRAAAALGLSPWQTALFVIQPQALRNALPVLASQGVTLVKDSALASAIGVFELARSAQSIQEQTFLPFEPWLGVTVIYFMLTFVLSLAVKLLERKVATR